MKEFWGRSRAHGACARSPGPKRKIPVAGLFASFSCCDHWRSGSGHAGPASSSSTSSPRAASSFATTGPPAPDPTTITSRTPVPLELLASQPPARPRPIREERGEVLEVPDEEADRASDVDGQRFERLKRLRLLGLRELGEGRSR